MVEKKYYSIEEAAQCLGVTPAEVHVFREKHELHGYRDGVSWKFKADEVDALAKQRRLREKLAASTEPGEDTGDVLLTELALGGSDAGSSGKVIGTPPQGPSDSDLRLADSDLKIGSEAKAPGDSGKGSSPKQGGSGVLDLAPEEVVLDESISLEDETEAPPAGVPVGAGDSAVDVAAAGKKLDDDDVVLGGSGTGSDITIGGDSGISLVDPTDSGLSLEEPLELERADEDSLELGEDDMLTFSDETDTDAPTELKADEEFMLTPLEEAAEEESESGSQVIALDSAPVSDSAATMLAGGPAAGMAAMLDEDFTGASGAGLAAAAGGAPAAGALAGAHPAFTEGAPMAGAASAVLPEAPYTGLNIAALSGCIVLLLLSGMMAYDLMRNMWGWHGAHPVNSWLMDKILGLFG